MNILLLGSGGRENALAWKIKQSPKVNKLYIAPGNAGTASIGINIALSASDFDGIRQFGTGRLFCSTIIQPVEKLAETCVELLLASDRSNTPSLVCLPGVYAPGGTTLEEY